MLPSVHREGCIRRSRTPIAFLLVLTLSLAAAPGAVASVAADIPDAPDVDAASPTTRFIVGFRSLPSDVRAGAAYFGGTVLDLAAVGAWAWMETPDPTAFEAAARADPSVWSVSRDSPRAVRAAYTPNDPQWPNQWGPQRVRANEAWDLTRGSTGVKVCVVDSGIDYNHRDLAGSRYLGGYNYVANTSDPLDTQDGHGTSVTGIIAATINNGKDVSGLAQVGFYAVKVTDSNPSAWLWWYGSGIEWCTIHGAHIINLSVTTLDIDSDFVRTKVEAAWNAGVLLVAAAGNLDYPGQQCGPPASPGYCIYYPAKYPQVIAVTSIYEDERLRGDSRYGPEAELTAPGSNITTLRPNNGIAYRFNGTSGAAPHVTGVAALIKSLNPTFTNQQIRDRLNATARDLGAPGVDIKYGHGLVDACRAVGPATLAGTVRDQKTGTPILGVTVTVQGAQRITDLDGRYAFPCLRTGGWSVQFTHILYISKTVSKTLSAGANWLNTTLRCKQTGCSTPVKPGTGAGVELMPTLDLAVRATEPDLSSEEVRPVSTTSAGLAPLLAAAASMPFVRLPWERPPTRVSWSDAFQIGTSQGGLTPSLQS